MAVAYLKAMLAGKKLFKARLANNKTTITLQDGFSITLSQKEIAGLARHAGISYRRYKDARQRQKLERVKRITKALFAVLLVRLQIQKAGDRALTYVKIKKALTETGIATKNIHTLFGVKRKPLQRFTNKKIEAINKKPAVLLVNKKHITFCSFGCFDDFGNPARIDTAAEKFLYGAPAYYFEIG